MLVLNLHLRVEVVLSYQSKYSPGNPAALSSLLLVLAVGFFLLAGITVDVQEYYGNSPKFR